MSGADPGSLIPGRRSDRFAYWFSRYVRRLLRRRFHAVRLETESVANFHDLASKSRPAIILLNHCSWWDPLMGVALGAEFLSKRGVLAPIDREQLERFGFFRRIGLFGIDPDDAESLKAMRSYVMDGFRENPRNVLWLTPQGRFTDVREPIRIRPGAANIAAQCDEIDVLSVSIEYAFWQDSRAEVLVRSMPVSAPVKTTTTGWQRAMTLGMQENADALSTLVRSRDASQFHTLIGARARTSFFYDLMLKLRGRDGEIAARRERDKEMS